VGGLLACHVVELVEECVTGDDADDGAKLWPGLGERPGAERAWRKRLGAARDLAGELLGDGVGLFVAEGVVDGVGAPEGIGGFAGPGWSPWRRRMRWMVVTCQRPPRLVLRPSSSRVAAIWRTKSPCRRSAIMRSRVAHSSSTSSQRRRPS